MIYTTHYTLHTIHYTLINTNKSFIFLDLLFQKMLPEELYYKNQKTKKYYYNKTRLNKLKN
jgi:hypothetical protein